MVPPLRRYYGTLRLPAVLLSSFRYLHEPIPSFRPSFAPLGGGRPTGGQEIWGSGLLVRNVDGDVGVSQVPWKPWWSLSVLFDPGRIRQAEWTTSKLPDTAPACVHDEGSTRLSIFRGSITRPLTWLSTLRRVGRPTATQDSLLAACPALSGGIRTRRVSTKGFRARVSSSQSFPYARTPYATPGASHGGNGHSLGGCQPTATHTCLASTSVGRLRWRATTVALPVGVKPMIKHPSPDQRKCSCQSGCRGLNNLTTSPLVGSSNAIRQFLESLQSEQASQRLSS